MAIYKCQASNVVWGKQRGEDAVGCKELIYFCFHFPLIV